MAFIALLRSDMVLGRRGMDVFRMAWRLPSPLRGRVPARGVGDGGGVRSRPAKLGHLPTALNRRAIGSSLARAGSPRRVWLPAAIRSGAGALVVADAGAPDEAGDQEE